MSDSSKTFHLFACCIPVKGYTQSIIYDLQRQTYDFITNDLYEILSLSGSTTIPKLKEEYGAENAEVLDEYFTFLEKNDYIFFSDLPSQMFPPIEEKFEIPSTISNASVELTRENKEAVLKTIAMLDECGCQSLSIILDKNEPSALKEALVYIDSTSIESVDLQLSYDSDLQNNLNTFFKDHTRVFNIYMFNAPESKKIESGYKYAELYLIKENRENAGCGKVHPLYFRVNLPFFMESKSCNSCLNKKLHVDCNGAIKSCPYSKQVHGNISDSSLRDVLGSSSYTSFAGIRKDEIAVCKDCEYRYMCSDCRVYIEDTNNSYSKPSSCSYNPYTGEWSEEF